MKQPTVLLVEGDPDERERLGAALERAGFDVQACGGPSSPDYVCIGGREARCPLIGPSDVVVLDLWLQGDALVQGTPALELLELYTEAGKPVATLGSHEGVGHRLEERPILHLRRRPDEEQLIAAVRGLLRRSDAGSANEQGESG